MKELTKADVDRLKAFYTRPDIPADVLERRETIVALCDLVLAGFKALDDACKIFHEIGAAIAARELLAKGVPPAFREKLEAQAKTDSQINYRASDGFEAIVRFLAECRVPGMTIHECREIDEANQPGVER